MDNKGKCKNAYPLILLMYYMIHSCVFRQNKQNEFTDHEDYVLNFIKIA